MNTDVAIAFRDARGPMLHDLVYCLDFLNGLEFFRSYKASTRDALEIKPHRQYLDVGCGVGYDVIEMAKRFPDAEFVGVDKSEGLLDIAKSRSADLPNTRFFINQAERLAFADDYFDGGRIDRSLQHMRSPATAIQEMVRVIRPGGRVVLSEPDWGTFVLFNGNEEISAKLIGLWLQSFAQPLIGRRLGQLMQSCNVENVRWRMHALMINRLSDADVVFDLTRLKTNGVQAGILTSREADNWWNEAQTSSQRGTFLASLNIVECCGQVV